MFYTPGRKGRPPGNCPTGTFTPAYSYDAENRLKGFGSITYTYDGDGTRVMKTGGPLYWGSGPLAESDTTASTWTDYIFFNGKRVAKRDSVTHLFFSDNLGSSSVMRNDSTGAIEEDLDYYPYGGVAFGTPADHYMFTGEERDGESTLDDFGDRYYASTLGRFILADKPFNDQSASDPQSWNLYAYVRNNPLRNIDPTGSTCQTNSSDGTIYDDEDGKGCAQVDVADVLSSPSVTVSATDDDVSYQLSNRVANLASNSNIADVALKGSTYAGLALAGGELAGAINGARAAAQLAAARAAADAIYGGAFPVSAAALDAAASSGEKLSD